MRMPSDHMLLGMAVAEDDADIFCVTKGGFGKRTPVSSYPTQKRGGQGVITIKDSPDRGDLVGVATVRNNHELMLMSQEGTVIRVPVESVRTTGRNTMGVRVMNLRALDRVSSMARLVKTAAGDVGAPIAPSEAAELERRAQEAAEPSSGEDATGKSEDPDGAESEVEA
jgi:DNA gyrase subunit A